MSYLQQKLSSQPFEALKSLFRRSVANFRARSWSNGPQTGSLRAVTSLNHAQVSLLISSFPVFLIFYLRSPGSWYLNCFNIPCSFFKIVWIWVSPTWNTLASSLTPHCFLFMLIFMLITCTFSGKLRFFFFAPPWKKARSADKVKNEFEFKTNEKRVWIKVAYTYLFDTFYARARALRIKQK